jgi:hypothetical protein
MAAHRKHFRNQRDFQRGIRFSDRDRRPQTAATRAYYRYVRLENFHCLPPSAQNQQDFNANLGSVLRPQTKLGRPFDKFHSVRSPEPGTPGHHPDLRFGSRKRPPLN